MIGATPGNPEKPSARRFTCCDLSVTPAAIVGSSSLTARFFPASADSAADVPRYQSEIASKATLDGIVQAERQHFPRCFPAGDSSQEWIWAQIDTGRFCSGLAIPEVREKDRCKDNCRAEDFHDGPLGSCLGFRPLDPGLVRAIFDLDLDRLGRATGTSNHKYAARGDRQLTGARASPASLVSCSRSGAGASATSSSRSTHSPVST